MATTNFKLFDENKANLLSDTEYANATQRLNGVQTGVASSQLNNKFAYQVSLVAYAIAQLMNANGLDANDTASVSAFVGNLQGALLQKVADMASTTEAAAGVLTNKYISPATMKAAALLLSGGVMNGILNMNGNRITNLPTPTDNSDPATKEYVDGFARIESGTYTGTGSTITLYFPFKPKVVFIYGYLTSSKNSFASTVASFTPDVSGSFSDYYRWYNPVSNSPTASSSTKITWSNDYTTLSFASILNGSGYTYFYITFG